MSSSSRKPNSVSKPANGLTSQSKQSPVEGKHRRKASCGICLKSIIDGKDEALFCEGPCQCWFHRYCVSVSQQDHFKRLSNSDDPYFCQACTTSRLHEQIADMKKTIERLSSELTEALKVKETVSTLNSEVTALRQALKEAQSHRRDVATQQQRNSRRSGQPRITSYARGDRIVQTPIGQ